MSSQQLDAFHSEKKDSEKSRWSTTLSAVTVSSDFWLPTVSLNLRVSLKWKTGAQCLSPRKWERGRTGRGLKPTALSMTGGQGPALRKVCWSSEIKEHLKGKYFHRGELVSCLWMHVPGKKMNISLAFNGEVWRRSYPCGSELSG